MLYALVANDRPNGVQARLDARPDHLKHLDALGDKLVIAGPFLDEAGNMTGSIVVIEAESLSEAETLFGRDPFVQRGVFESYTIRPWRLTINKTRG